MTWPFTGAWTGAGRGGRGAAWLRGIALATAISLALPGCVTSGPFGSDEYARPRVPLTPAEQQLRADADEFNETVAGGIATGVVVGAVLGALAAALSGNRQDIAQGALIGAAYGGVLGGVDGYLTAKARENANNQIRMLASMEQDVRADNQRLQRLVASSRQVLEDSKTRLEVVRRELDARRMTLAQAEAERQRVEQNRALMAQTLQKAAEKRDTYMEAAAEVRMRGGDTADLEREIEALEAQVLELEANIAELDAALAVTRVG